MGKLKAEQERNIKLTESLHPSSKLSDLIRIDTILPVTNLPKIIIIIATGNKIKNFKYENS